MKTTPKVFAFIGTLLAACLAHAADTKPIARVIAITEVETDDATGYASWVAKANEIVKTKLGIDTYFHVYVSNYDGTKAGSVRLVSSAESVSAMAKNAATLNATADPAYRDILDHYRAIRKNGARVLYQAVRFDGTVKGAYVYSTTVKVTDEPGYLKSLDGLRAIFDAKGFQDAKINVYRVLAGRSDYTHRVSISVASNERLAGLLDLMGTDGQLAAWIAEAAKYRTVVGNTTGHDITK
jgi:uncharacterized protein (UPF0333 family)